MTSTAQPKPDTRTFLHIGAANYRSHVWVNQKRVCDHEGGFTPFDCEVTSVLQLRLQLRRHRGRCHPPRRWHPLRRHRLVQLRRPHPRRLARHRSRGLHRRLRRPPHARRSLPARQHRAHRLRPRPRRSRRNLGHHRHSRSRSQNHRQHRRRRPRPLRRQSRQTHPLVARDAQALQGHPRLRRRQPHRRHRLPRHPRRWHPHPAQRQGHLPSGRQHARRSPCPRRPRQYSIEDVATIFGYLKDLNANFVRLAHYPHDERMERTADRDGVMVWSEIPHLAAHLLRQARGLRQGHLHAQRDDPPRPQQGLRHPLVRLQRDPQQSHPHQLPHQPCQRSSQARPNPSHHLRHSSDPKPMAPRWSRIDPLTDGPRRRRPERVHRLVRR